MNIEQIRAIVKECTFHDYKFTAEVDGRGEMYLHAVYIEPDTYTQKPEPQFTRRWLISPMMTKSEVVRTVFKCAITSMEHRTREWFQYRGRAIFGPHFDVDVLHSMCGEEESFEHR
jgi:hypothetical protein